MVEYFSYYSVFLETDFQFPVTQLKIIILDCVQQQLYLTPGPFR
jgi:hypothetical protein